MCRQHVHARLSVFDPLLADGLRTTALMACPWHDVWRLQPVRLCADQPMGCHAGCSLLLCRQSQSPGVGQFSLVLVQSTVQPSSTNAMQLLGPARGFKPCYPLRDVATCSAAPSRRSSTGSSDPDYIPITFLVLVEAPPTRPLMLLTTPPRHRMAAARAQRRSRCSAT